MEHGMDRKCWMRFTELRGTPSYVPLVDRALNFARSVPANQFVCMLYLIHVYGRHIWNGEERRMTVFKRQHA